MGIAVNIDFAECSAEFTKQGQDDAPNFVAKMAAAAREECGVARSGQGEDACLGAEKLVEVTRGPEQTFLKHLVDHGTRDGNGLIELPGERSAIERVAGEFVESLENTERNRIHK